MFSSAKSKNPIFKKNADKLPAKAPLRPVGLAGSRVEAVLTIAKRERMADSDLVKNGSPHQPIF